MRQVQHVYAVNLVRLAIPGQIGAPLDEDRLPVRSRLAAGVSPVLGEQSGPCPRFTAIEEVGIRAFEPQKLKLVLDSLQPQFKARQIRHYFPHIGDASSVRADVREA